MFFFKKKEIVVDCFTFLEAVNLNFPIDRAIKFYPKEFKHIPNKIELKHNQDPNSKLTVTVPTIRVCTGITDLYKTGFVIPAWDAFSIEVRGDNNYSINSKNNNINATCHPRNQYGNDVFPNCGHVKILSPWLLKEKTGVKFVWMQPGWNKTLNAEVSTLVPAVVDYKYQFNSHISFFVKNGSIINYDIGDPLVHVIPLSEHNVKIKTHLIDVDVWEKQRKILEDFAHLENHRKLKYPKVFEQTRKCPFGFGK